MTDKEYGSLSFEEQASVLWDVGVFVDAIDYRSQTVKLYSLYSFFVEVYYNIGNKHVEKLAIAGPEEMNKFLGRISIELL